jgi:hypothetical protein
LLDYLKMEPPKTHPAAPETSEISEFPRVPPARKQFLIKHIELASFLLFNPGRRVHSMTLKIHRLVEDEQVVFALTGRIQAEQVPELLALLKSESPAYAIALDLDQVKLVDREAVLFLALGEAHGVELRNCSAFIREWIHQERNTTPVGSQNPTGSED